MTSLEILYIIDVFDLSGRRDQNYIIKYMSKRHNVTLLTSRRHISSNATILNFTKENNCSLVIARELFKVGKVPVYIDNRIYRLLNKKWDIVHTFTFFTFSTILGALARGRKIVRSEIGAYTINRIRPDPRNFELKGVRKALIKLYKRVYDKVTVFNSLEKDILMNLGFSSDRIIEIPPMVDFKKFSSLFIKNKSKVNKEDKVTIGLISRITDRKGIHTIPRIFKLLLERRPDLKQKVRFLLAGRCVNHEYISKVISSFKKVLGKEFIYLGELPDSLDFYSLIDVFIFPSMHKETGAIVVLEALASGKIVIARNLYPVNLYIRNGYNGFLYTNDRHASKILEYVIENLDSSDLVNIRYNSINTAKRYDYRINCKKLEKVYKILTSRRR